MKTDTKERIMNLLKANEDGVTITGIAEELKLSRQTVSKYVRLLKDRITVEPFATAKVCKVKRCV